VNAQQTSGGLCNQLREAITTHGLSAQELSKQSDVEQTLILNFMRGKDIGLKQATKLASYLGLELRPQSRESTE
jgi:ribosome-binding protein aMBF1 (putative translation factor)